MQKTLVETSSLVKNGHGVVFALVLTGSMNPAKATLYDGLDATGTKLLSVTVDRSTTMPIKLYDSLEFTTGLYVDVDGVGAECLVFWDEISPVP